MVGSIYGTTSCGFHGFREDFFLIFPHFKSIEANDSMASISDPINPINWVRASIDTMSMDGRFYVGDHI